MAFSLERPRSLTIAHRGGRVVDSKRQQRGTLGGSQGWVRLRNFVGMTTTPEKKNYPLGLPVLGIIGLGALAAPRVVLHDLHIIEEGSFINSLFVFVPLIIWLAVVLGLRVTKPFICLLAVGVVYGVFLAAGHLVFWEQAFPDGAPQLGGNHSEVDSALQGGVMRTAVTFSSLVTGTAVGAVTGLVAKGLRAVMVRMGRPEAAR